MAFWSRKQATVEPPPSPPVESQAHSLIAFDRTAAIMLKEYTRSIYLWRCVDMIAQMSSSVVLDVTPKKNRERTQEESALDAVIKHPNPQWNAAALQYFVAASLAVANRAYLKKVTGEMGRNVLELWPIPANEVTVKYVKGNSGPIAAFERVTSDGKETFKVEDDGSCDLIFIRRPALNSDTDKSPAIIAVPPAETFGRILQRCYDIVSNSSNITGVLSTEAEIAKDTVQKVKDQILKFKTGLAESGGTLVTANAKWELTRLSEDPKTALSVEIKDSLARDVCMTFGVPTQLVGLPGTDTYNNLALARVGLLTDTVLPGYVNVYVSALNAAMFGADAEAIIIPNVAAIPSMAASRLQLVDTASKATMLTLNEQRLLLGYPTYDDDELANVPVELEKMRQSRLKIEMSTGNVGELVEQPG